MAVGGVARASNARQVWINFHNGSSTDRACTNATFHFDSPSSLASEICDHIFATSA